MRWWGKRTPIIIVLHLFQYTKNQTSLEVTPGTKCLPCLKGVALLVNVLKSSSIFQAQGCFINFPRNVEIPLNLQSQILLGQKTDVTRTLTILSRQFGLVSRDGCYLCVTCTIGHGISYYRWQNLIQRPISHTGNSYCSLVTYRAHTMKKMT